jgi:hypothetical protein
MADTAEKTETATVLREGIQRVVNDLPLDELYAAERYVSYLRDLANDPLLRTLLNAPFDDEPWTAEDEAALEEAREDVRAGRVVSHEEVVRSLRERQ